MEVKRRCIKCKQWKYLEEFTKTRSADGVIRTRASCRPCDSRAVMDRRDRNGVDEDRKKAVNRARDRARKKLSRVCPELYRALYIEELAKEGIEPTKRMLTYLES